MTSPAGRAPTRGTEMSGADAPGIPGAFTADGDLGEVAAATLTRARDHLLGLQDPRGWWIGELETNVTMDAEDVLLRHFLGILSKTDAAETARVDPLAAARGRHLGQLLRRPRRPVHHGRGLRRAQAGGRRPGRGAHAARRRLDHRPGRRHRDQGLHPDLAGAVRALVVGRPAGDPAGDHLPAVLVPAQHLRLGLLGPADGRRARGGRLLQAEQPAAVPDRRAVRRGARQAPQGAAERRLVGGVQQPRQGAAQDRAEAAEEAPGGPRGAAASTGSSPARRPTAAGAASSRRGCTRSWRCT